MLRGIIGSLIVVASLGLPSLAMAEESSTEGDGSPPEFVERARELFQMGVELADNEEYAEAATRFEQALGLHDAATIRFNLASVYEFLERRSDAAAQLEAVVAAEDASDEVRAQAEELLTRYRAELGRLRITIDEADGGVEVSLDERVLSSEELDQPLWVEPGSHLVTAMQGGEYIARRDVEVAPGSVEVVALELTAPIQAPAVDTEEGTGEGDEEERGGRRRLDRRVWVGIGVGIGLAVTAIVLGVALGTREPEVEDPVVGNFGPGVLEWR